VGESYLREPARRPRAEVDAFVFVGGVASSIVVAPAAVRFRSGVRGRWTTFTVTMLDASAVSAAGAVS
jgi:hypothetical protein